MIGLISGSLREDSHNSHLLGEIQGYLAEPSVYIDISQIPAYNEDIEKYYPPEAVQKLREDISSVKALVISTPEYNGSVPGHLKNVLDWLSRPAHDNPLQQMPVVIYGVTTGMFGAVWAQADLKKILKVIGAKPLEEPELPIGLARPNQIFLEDEQLKTEILGRLKKANLELKEEVYV